VPIAAAQPLPDCVSKNITFECKIEKAHYMLSIFSLVLKKEKETRD
jgi:hypothetical protein